eukprot:6195228-Amphidinium_carterae.1
MMRTAVQGAFSAMLADHWQGQPKKETAKEAMNHGDYSHQGRRGRANFKMTCTLHVNSQFHVVLDPRTEAVSHLTHVSMRRIVGAQSGSGSLWLSPHVALAWRVSLVKEAMQAAAAPDFNQPWELPAEEPLWPVHDSQHAEVCYRFLTQHLLKCANMQQDLQA